MIPKAFISIAVLTLFITGCTKKVDFQNEEIEYLIGDYEWVYTKFNNYEYGTSDTSSDKYGLRITEKSKLEFYKNGKFTEDYKIKSGVDTYQGTTFLYYRIDYNTHFSFEFSGDTIMTYSAPYTTGRNFYVKK